MRPGTEGGKVTIGALALSFFAFPVKYPFTKGVQGAICMGNVDSAYICRSFSENVPFPVEALTAHTIPFSGLKDGTHDFDFPPHVVYAAAEVIKVVLLLTIGVLNLKPLIRKEV